MPKINQEEYEVLKELEEKGFEEIRRNSTGDIAVRGIGEKVTSHQYQTEHNDKFKFLEATGDYWSIAELIEEYEEDYKGSWEHAIEFSKEMRRESEETEVKNIEWLKEEVEKRIKTIESDDITFVGSEYYDEGYIDGMRDALYRINQLDEPEVTEEQAWDIIKEIYGISNESFVRSVMRLVMEHVKDDTTIGEIREKLESEALSQKWIDWHKEFVGKRPDGTRVEVVKEKYLQNLLVPKQELPVIPNYIAKWISVHHEQFDLYPALKRLESNALSWEDVYEWYRRNTHTFVNAYLTGKYEVEERELTVKEVIEEHIELLKKQEVGVNLKPYYDLWEELKNE